MTKQEKKDQTTKEIFGFFDKKTKKTNKYEFINKCEIILRYFLYEIFKEYFLSLKTKDNLFIFKKKSKNFIEWDFAYKIENKDKKEENINIIFQKLNNVKITNLYFYNLYSWKTIKQFQKNHSDIFFKNNVYFKDLEKHVDQIHFNKNFSFSIWKIIKNIFLKERDKYSQLLKKLEKDEINKEFEKKKYLSFKFLFPNDDNFVKFRKNCLHMNPSTKEDSNFFKRKFPEKYKEIERKNKK